MTRHTLLTDKQVMIYYELPKLPEVVNADDLSKLWLALFKAKTEEELKQIEAMGVPIMEQAIQAFRHVSTTEEFKELERMRSRARHNEAAALRNARNEGEQRANEKWQGVIADKDAEIAALRARLGE